MHLHQRNVEGSQSQSYMRFKVIDLLSDDIEDLPQSITGNERNSLPVQKKWLDSAMVVLDALEGQWSWILWKINGEEDLDDVFAACVKVKNALLMLDKDGVFDRLNMYKVLASYLKRVQKLTELESDLEDYLEEPKHLFPGLMATLQPKLIAYHQKYSMLEVG